jgi:hypothetical protein
VADLPFQLAAPLAARLQAAADVEGKLPRALLGLGLPTAGDVGVLDDPHGWLAGRLAEIGVAARSLEVTPAAGTDPDGPAVLGAPDASLDAIVACWSRFRGVDPAALAEADRVLNEDGLLLVVHDYGRDEVSALRHPGSPEYTSWSRRDGPFLRGGGFRIRVLHCFWTFATLDEARSLLEEAFGAPGAALAATLRRPRLSWNLAIYHRRRGGGGPAAGKETPA